MTLKELKTLLDKAKGKIIVVEDEKPIMVITPYEEQGLPAMQEPQPQRVEQSLRQQDGLTLDDLPL